MDVAAIVSTLLTFMLCSMCSVNAKRASPSYVERPSNEKDFKKLLRTKNNVMVLFTNGRDDSAQVRKHVALLEDAAPKVYGKGTLALVNCESADGRKLCKKMKVTPSPTILKHYHNGEYHKDYDRGDNAQSLGKFMADPKGDLPWDEDPTATNVKHVQSDKEFGKLLRAETPMLVMFYAPWCGHCKRMKPDYAAAAVELKPSATLAAVDCTKPENEKLQKQFAISGYPTLIYFDKGKMMFNYGGENNKDSIIKWMENPQPPKAAGEGQGSIERVWAEEAPEITHLTKDTFDEVIAASKSVLVMFYAPWCGHCKSMKPDYAVAATEINSWNKPGVFIAALDATQADDLAKKYQLQGFPTLMYFEDGEYKWNFDKRQKDEIVEFMRNPTEPPPPPVPESPWREETSHVVHLDGDQIKATLKKKRNAMVMFYAPWCGHCKAAKPEFTKAADAFKDDNRIMFAAVDCTAEGNMDFCVEEYKVFGYPSLQYFAYGKQGKPVEVSERTATAFMRFMADEAGVELNPDVMPPYTPPPEDIWPAPVLDLGADDSLQSAIAKYDRMLVIFHAPWCPHCKKAKEPFVEAAGKLPEGLNRAMAAVDCSRFAELCKSSGVSGYPTMHVYADGKLLRVHGGPRTADGFYQAVMSDDADVADPGAGEKAVPKDEEPKKTVPKDEELKKTVPKDEEPKKTVPKDEELKKTVPKDEEPKKTVPKDEEPKKTVPKDEELKKTVPKDEEPKKTVPKDEGAKKAEPKVEEAKKVEL